jgi:hypothetical protein
MERARERVDDDEAAASARSDVRMGARSVLLAARRA